MREGYRKRPRMVKPLQKRIILNLFRHQWLACIILKLSELELSNLAGRSKEIP